MSTEFFIESYRDKMRSRIFLALIAAGTTASTKELYEQAEKIAMEYYNIRFPKEDV